MKTIMVTETSRRRLLLASLAAFPFRRTMAQQPPPQPYVPKQSDRPEPLEGDEDGFVPIFDGKTLDGWEGDPKYWRVADGIMTGEVTPETLLRSNTFLIWRGGVAGVARSGVAGVARSGAAGVGPGGAAGVAQGGVAGVAPGGVAGVAPGGAAGVAPSGVAGVAPSGVAGVAPSGVAGVAPGGAAGVAPGGAAGVAPSGAAGVAPGGAAGVAPGGAAGVAPGGAAGVAPGGAAGVAPSGAAGVAPGGAAAIAPGGAIEDFELKVDYRITAGGNSGVNYRSVVVPDTVTPANRFAMRGYQCDIDGQNRYTGNNYEEKGRLFLAQRGDVTHVTGTRKPIVLARTGDNQELARSLTEGWNAVDLVVRGNVMIHNINGRLMSVTIDDDPKRERTGLIGVQVHVGPPMRIEYRNWRIRKW